MSRMPTKGREAVVAVVLAGVLGACSGSETSGAGPGGGGGAAGGAGSGAGGGGGDAASACATDPGPEAPVSFEVVSITIPNYQQTPTHTVGFDLDDFDTRSSTDAVGCGFVDQPGGVDNSVAKLVPVLESQGIAVNDLIDEALSTGEAGATFTLVGYDGSADDECVLLDFAIAENRIEGVVAEVVDGELVAEVGTVALGFDLGGGDGGAGAAVQFVVHAARAALRLVDGQVEGGEVGGVVDRGDPEDPAPGTINDLIDTVFSTMDLSDIISPSEIVVLLDPIIDIDASDGTSCAAHSVGFSFTAEPAP